mgnify:CR=1 FL=1
MMRVRSTVVTGCWLAVLLGALVTGEARAQAQAWLDRDRIAFGESTMAVDDGEA